MLYIKGLKILCGKRISMLTGLKVLSLACKCAFYRPQYNAKGRGEDLMELNFEGFEMQKMKYNSGKSLKSRWKNGLFSQLSCLLSELWLFKFSKWLIFCVFGWRQQKISYSLDKNCKCIGKIFWVLSENGIVNRFWSSCL